MTHLYVEDMSQFVNWSDEAKNKHFRMSSIVRDAMPVLTADLFCGSDTQVETESNKGKVKEFKKQVLRDATMHNDVKTCLYYAYWSSFSFGAGVPGVFTYNRNDSERDKLFQEFFNGYNPKEQYFGTMAFISVAMQEKDGILNITPFCEQMGFSYNKILNDTYELIDLVVEKAEGLVKYVEKELKRQKHELYVRPFWPNVLGESLKRQFNLKSPLEIEHKGKLN